MIAIIILNYNTADDTIKCVNSIVKTTESKYKIYIVDNKSTDNSYLKLLDEFSESLKIEVIEAPSNDGYAAGNNVGIRKALKDGAELIILSNSDIVFKENSIDNMYNRVNDSQEIGIIGPKILLTNRQIQNSPRLNYNFYNYLIGKKPFKYFDFMGTNNKVYFKNYNYKEELLFKGLVSGCCIGLSRKYFKLCGLLDEGTFLYFEESIIAQKADKVGLVTCILPNSVVLHKSSLSIGDQNSAFSRYHRYYSSVYMLRKYTKINNIQLIFLWMLNLLPLGINSIFCREYRFYAKKFIKDINNLLYI